MPGNEVQPLVGTTRALVAGTAGALLRRLRLSRAEAADISLFTAPSRLQVARQMLGAGLFAGLRLPAALPCNDN